MMAQRTFDRWAIMSVHVRYPCASRERRVRASIRKRVDKDGGVKQERDGGVKQPRQTSPMKEIDRPIKTARPACTSSWSGIVVPALQEQIRFNLSDSRWRFGIPHCKLDLLMT